MFFVCENRKNSLAAGNYAPGCAISLFQILGAPLVKIFYALHLILVVKCSSADEKTFFCSSPDFSGKIHQCAQGGDFIPHFPKRSDCAKRG